MTTRTTDVLPRRYDSGRVQWTRRGRAPARRAALRARKDRPAPDGRTARRSGQGGQTRGSPGGSFELQPELIAPRSGRLARAAGDLPTTRARADPLRPDAHIALHVL